MVKNGQKPSARLDIEDTRRDYSEERRLTPRGTVIRLISARKANEREQRKYDETLST